MASLTRFIHPRVHSTTGGVMLLALLASCAQEKPAQRQDPPASNALDSSSTASSAATPPPTAAAESPSPDPVPVVTNGAPREVGQGCTQSADCASGVCEGEGCGPDEGRCVEAQRACTKDLRAYCGCDAVTFRASGSCPRRTFKSRGACPAGP